MNNPSEIQVGSKWERILSGRTWTVEALNPNGTVTIVLKKDDHRETETHDPVFFVGAFRAIPSENPLAKVYHE